MCFYYLVNGEAGEIPARSRHCKQGYSRFTTVLRQAEWEGEDISEPVSQETCLMSSTTVLRGKDYVWLMEVLRF
ncbi:hypothetical protein SAMN05661091_0950 [Paenibacillus uliginis N3/975]|uniref:Uncharacterized protein n=1 Tax=Paenibacillus uliginis N3/975 TaxID=1313296 RepID=A0A1X7GQY5_9BACL|nr:hypothetical protein SAMN05661091_0950 [Paenibacillus uliginis N3/975]